MGGEGCTCLDIMHLLGWGHALATAHAHDGCGCRVWWHHARWEAYAQPSSIDKRTLGRPGMRRMLGAHAGRRAHTASYPPQLMKRSGGWAADESLPANALITFPLVPFVHGRTLHICMHMHACVVAKHPALLSVPPLCTLPCDDTYAYSCYSCTHSS